ncbi:poly-gamma-glutamate synthase PgsB [candidate division KSB1 bacterium]|nr:poly-gamma-glutamate synthase PgsB [candidate division KSB1 bacterium]
MAPVLFSLLLLLCFWLIEYGVHYIKLRKIPTRILVTGTRGKSSITRLIAAGLNAGGIKTLAKTTGSATQIIMPDNSVQNLNRNGSASILEQCRVVSIAEKLKTQALVIESMALRPFLQWIESFRIIKPHILVISNVGPDHLDISGRDLEEIALSFSQTIPEGGKLFTGEKEYYSILEKQAAAKKCDIHLLQQEETDPKIDYQKLPYIEHPQNIELALTVCEHVGVDKQTAFAGMKKVTPDIGVLREIKTTINTFPVTFINAFAANDPLSIRNIYFQFQKSIGNKRFLLVINLRNDRPHRSLQIAGLLVSTIRADLYIFCGGDIKYIIIRKIQKHVKKESVLEFNKTDKIIQYLEKKIDRETVIMGIGNIAGAGIQLTNYFIKNEITNKEPG